MYDKNIFLTNMRPFLPLIASVIALFFCNSPTPAQTPPATSCTNSNFTLGTFANWTGCYGNFYSPCITQGFDSTSAYPRHKIFTDVTAIDPKTCDNVYKVCPGETHSARLGRDAGASPASGAELKYCIQVNTGPYYFVYKTAIVLENGNHMPFEQPNFVVEITDTAGNYVDPVNGYRYFVYGTGVPGWQTCTIGPGIAWRDWTSDTVNLSAFVGQTVNVKFTSRDCPFGNHHGYAYINTYCITPAWKYWTGLLSNQWNNPGNWSPAGLPSGIDIVIIPASATTMPVVNVDGMTCQDLMLGEGASVTIPEGFHLTVNGDVVMNFPQ
jgi:hypothetical protein